jgi:hypothetical protein
VLGDIKRVFVYLVVIATERRGNPVRWVESALARQSVVWNVGKSGLGKGAGDFSCEIIVGC